MKTLATLALIACFAPLAASAQQAPGAHFIENWDLDENGSVSLAELTEKRGDVFYMFDVDENGMLDAAEYGMFDETRAADMAANAEGHGKGQGAGRMQEGMTLAFNDTDGDGQVSRAEFLAHTADWLAMVDRDNDGVITSRDFGPKKTN